MTELKLIVTDPNGCCFEEGQELKLYKDEFGEYVIVDTSDEDCPSFTFTEFISDGISFVVKV